MYNYPLFFPHKPLTYVNLCGERSVRFATKHSLMAIIHTHLSRELDIVVKRKLHHLVALIEISQKMQFQTDIPCGCGFRKCR